MRKRTLNIVAAVLFAYPVLGLANPITFTFTGSIPFDGGLDPRGSGGFCGGQLCGSDIFGYLTIDDRPTSADFFTSYSSSGSPFGMVILADSELIIFDSLIFQIADNSNSALSDCPPCDILWLEASSTTEFGRFFQGFFFDPTGLAISDNNLLPDPGLFSWGCTEALEGCTIRTSVDAFGTTSWCCEFDWTFRRSPIVIPVISSVPEPGFLGLFGAGLAAIGLVRRGKKKAS